MNNIEKDKPKDSSRSKNIAIIILSILLIAAIGSCAAILIDNHQKELTREAGLATTVMMTAIPLITVKEKNLYMTQPIRQDMMKGTI